MKSGPQRTQVPINDVRRQEILKSYSHTSQIPGIHSEFGQLLANWGSLQLSVNNPNGCLELFPWTCWIRNSSDGHTEKELHSACRTTRGSDFFGGDE